MESFAVKATCSPSNCKDKRDIHMLSTNHSADIALLDKVNRVTGGHVIKTVAIVDYVKSMGGVDLSNQIIQYYDVLRNSVKWWRKLFFISSISSCETLLSCTGNMAKISRSAAIKISASHSSMLWLLRCPML